MGIDSRNINRGACFHPGCKCTDFQRSSGSSKCFVCSHPPTNHKILDSSQQSGVSSDKRTWSDVAPHNTDKGGLDSSFGYCSAECRDRCELERAKSEVTRALEEFEVNPERGSTQAPAKEPVSHNATPHVQPLTRPRLQSEDTPTIVGAACRAPPTQQSPPPQEQRTVSVHCYKVSLEAVRAMSLYDSGKLQTVWGIKGLLVTSIEVNKATLDCGVQPLDLITLFDGTPAQYLCDLFGECSLLSNRMKKHTADVWVARTPGIPSMSLIQKAENLPVHQSMRKHRIVGLLVMQKDLADPASFLGINMDKHSHIKKVDRISAMSAGEKAGLHYNDIIHSVTMVTAEKALGPYTDWSFEEIQQVARDSPSLCALLLTVAKY